MQMMQKPREGGFTLIEIVVSLLIFAFLSVLAWQGLYQIVRVEERSREQSTEQNDISQVWAVVVQDLLHLRSRSVRNQFGDTENAFVTPSEPYLVRFSRGGLPVLAGVLPNGMQRVAYWVDGEDQLIRRTWPLLDGYREDEGRSQVLLQQVDTLQFEQLDSGNYFQSNWPPLNENLDPAQLPRMIRVTLTMDSGLTMSRLIPGVETVQLGNAGTPDGADGGQTQ
jgi:general secretion pathway protein J